MCGIVGKVHFSSVVSHEEVEKMAEKIQHRGPDDGGVYIDNHVGLGSRRLAIRDLGPSGHMPMVSNDGELIIVYNGEIYDFESDRLELERDGVVFKSHSDTEVILYLYRKYGIQCLKRLRGMFAFVIYDKKKNILFGARDRFGEKPFKYYWDGTMFVFASELKALFESSEIQKEIDLQAISDYLTYQYVPHPHTGFKNIFKLPQAHYFTLDLATRQLHIVRYWDIDYREKQKLNEDEWCEKIRTNLEHVVRIRMASDVPLGAFLSGGVDSSAVVAMMAKNSKEPIKTFSIGFEEKNFDEREYARKISKLFHTDHHEMIVSPDMMIRDLPKLVVAYEEPYGDSSMLPTYYLAQFTKQHVTVALNGDSGDENFAGYGRYKVFGASRFFQIIPSWLRKTGTYLFKCVHKIYPNTFASKVLRFIASLDEDPAAKYLRYIGYFTEQEKQEMFMDEFKHEMNSLDSSGHIKTIYSSQMATCWLDKLLYTDFHSYLPDDLMVKVDIATMQHSLESRAPLLDHHFVAMTSLIPPEFKLRNGESKYIFKKALEGILPHDILYRKKMGFGVPVGEWFRGELKGYYRDTVIDNSHFIHRIIKKEYIEKLFHENIAIGGEGKKLWLLLCLELWHRAYFTKD